MKRMLVCSLFVGLPWSSLAQQNASSMLGRLPEPPSDACGLAPTGRQAYLDVVDEVLEDIRAELEEREAAQEAYTDRNGERWIVQMMKQSGMTDTQIEKAKAKGEDMSDKEARELADEVLQHRANISLEEVEKLAEMDEAAQEAWAQAYAAEMAAGVQAQTPQERAAARKEHGRAKGLVTLTEEQQEMFKKSNAVGMALSQKMLDLDRDAENAYAQDITPIDRRLAKCQKDLEHATGAQYSALARQAEQIQTERNEALRNHCAQFTPNYCDMLRRYLTWAKAAQSGFDRYEEMENEKFRLQTNAPDSALLVAVGIMGLKEAANCANLLKSAFKYHLFDDESVRPD